MPKQISVLGYKFTSEEFKQKKAEYNAKYGYTIHIPDWYDIVKIGFYDEPTEQELKDYKSKILLKDNPVRYEEIRKLKQKKKEKFLRMMDSPTPNIVRNMGTIMTFLDDANDMLGTGAVVLRTAAHIAPKIAGRFLLGPAGWLLGAADVFNIAMALTRTPLPKYGGQKTFERTSELNPLSRQSKVRRAAKLRRIFPTKGEIIEAAQVSNQMTGYGLCLGPIVGLVLDCAFANYRIAMGSNVKVHVSAKIPEWKEISTAFRVVNAMSLPFHDIGQSPDDIYRDTLFAANYATQILYPYLQDWHPLDQIENAFGIEKIAPFPYRPSTLELFEEEGIDWRERVGWVHNNKLYASANEIFDYSEEIVRENVNRYYERNRHNWDGYLASQQGVVFGENMLACIEGEDMVQYDYIPTNKACSKLFYAGYMAPEFIPDQQRDKFISWLDAKFYGHSPPKVEDIVATAAQEFGIIFTQETPQR
ncbi:hypothetical protein ES702_06533 [subsurface metagenome]